jgi:DNA-binding transcriptional LysR family regulator
MALPSLWVMADSVFHCRVASKKATRAYHFESLKDGLRSDKPAVLTAPVEIRESRMSIYDHLEFRHLKYIMAVAEEGSFTKAAERVHVVQSNLSKQISEIEDLYSVTLFKRGNRGGATLTESGQSLYNFARQLVDLREEAVNSIQAVQQISSRPFRLGFSQYVEHLVLQTVSRAYRELFPKGEVVAEGDDTDVLLDRVQKGELDAALVTLPLGLEGLCEQPVMHERMVVLICKDDALATKEDLSVEDLNNRLAIFSDPRHHPSAHARLLEMLEDQSIHPKVMAPNFNFEHIQYLVSEHMCIALIRENEVLRDSLTTRPIRGVSWTIDSAIVFRPNDKRGALSLLLRDLTRRFPVADAKLRKKPPQSASAETLPFDIPKKKAS